MIYLTDGGKKVDMLIGTIIKVYTTTYILAEDEGAKAPSLFPGLFGRR